MEFLAEGQDVKRSRTFIEITDAHGRAFRYVSTKERSHESTGLGTGKDKARRVDDAFMAEHMQEKDTPRTLLHAYLEKAEDEEEDDDESSDQED